MHTTPFPTPPAARTPRRHGATRQRGITLVEACIVLAITAVSAATAAPGMQTLIDARRLEGTARQLATDLHFVRGEAVARNLPLRLSVQASAGGSCYVIHSGAAGACTCAAASPAATCTGDALEIKTVALASTTRIAVQSNAASMLFDPLHGTASPTATLRVTGPRGQAVHHVVNVMGRVRSCSPVSALPGYPVC